MAKIIGIKRLDYQNKNNRHVQGYSFHLSEPQKDVVGESVFNIFLSDDRAADFVGLFVSLGDCIGQEVVIYYNRFGSADGISLEK